MPNPFELEWEHEMPHFSIENATATLWEAEAENPATIICENERWGVNVSWNTAGGTCNALSGKWVIQCYAEAMGPREEPELPAFELAVVSHPSPYEKNCEFAPNLLKPGAYKLAVTITMIGDDNLPTPFAMLGDGPLFQVYKFEG